MPTISQLQVPSIESEAHLWSLIIKTRGCWIWRGMTNEGGYGIMRWQGSSRIEVVHRFVWALVMKRPIPAGKVLDHTCNVRRCCRPTPDEISGKVHLDPTTQRINMQRIAMRRKGLI